MLQRMLMLGVVAMVMVTIVVARGLVDLVAVKVERMCVAMHIELRDNVNDHFGNLFSRCFIADYLLGASYPANMATLAKQGW